MWLFSLNRQCQYNVLVDMTIIVDLNSPTEIILYFQIRKKSHASDAGLREGDTVVSINGVPMSGTTHQSAMGLVEVASNQIVMEVIR